MFHDHRGEVLSLMHGPRVTGGYCYRRVFGVHADLHCDVILEFNERHDVAPDYDVFGG